MTIASLFEDSDLPPSRPPARPKGAPRALVLRQGDFPEGPPRGPGICGIDEAGRGPLAGPVYAGACVLPEGFPLELLDDSKALSEKRRDEAFAAITQGSLAWAVDFATPGEIDEVNILKATFLAMGRAYARLTALLGAPPDQVFVDGNRDPCLPRPSICVIKGDSIVPAIMAASILAKVCRDRAMERWDWLYPDYGYARHKGYPTAAHREACQRLGPSPIQRKSFNY